MSTVEEQIKRLQLDIKIGSSLLADSKRTLAALLAQRNGNT